MHFPLSKPSPFIFPPTASRDGHAAGPVTMTLFGNGKAARDDSDADSHFSFSLSFFLLFFRSGLILDFLCVKLRFPSLFSCLYLFCGFYTCSFI